MATKRTQTTTEPETETQPAKRGRKPGTAMSDEHKAALAAGRTEATAVRNYLDALRHNRPKRGRRRTEETINRRIKLITDELLPNADPISELRLTQERLDLEEERFALLAEQDMTDLRDAFVTHAKAYSERHGISYATWRAVGIDAKVLRDAGVTR